MDSLTHVGPGLSVKDSDDDGESAHTLLVQHGGSDDPAGHHDGEGELFTAVQLSETSAEHYLDKSVMHVGTVSTVAVIPKLIDGQVVQLEDGSTAYVSSTYKEGSTVIHLEDGTTAYITSDPPDGLIFAGGLDGTATSTSDGFIATKKLTGRVLHSTSGGSERHFRCEFDGCGKTFATGYGLKSHTRVHTGEKPYKCPHDNCDKSFKTSGDLQKHVRTHTGERPFTCPFEGCGRSFTTSNIRKVHIRTHTGERPYTCEAEGCGKAFASATNYKNHIRIHSGEKPYVCSADGCNKRFTEYSSLYKHHVVHTHTKPYTCPHCGKNYRQTSTLAMHRRTAHGEDTGDDITPQQIQILNANPAATAFAAADAQQSKRIKLSTIPTGVHTVVVNSTPHTAVVGDGGRCLVAGSSSSAGQPITIASVGSSGQDQQFYIVTNSSFQVLSQLSQPHIKLNDSSSEHGDIVTVDESDQLQSSPSADPSGTTLVVAGYTADGSETS